MQTIHWRLTSDRVHKYHAIQILDPKLEPFISRLRAICGKPSPGPGWFTPKEGNPITIPEFEICKTCLKKLGKNRPLPTLYITNIDYVNKSVTLDSVPNPIPLTIVKEAED